MKALKEKQASTDAPTSHIHTDTSPVLYMPLKGQHSNSLGKLCRCVKIDVYDNIDRSTPTW